nr:AmmeMemoRadiSam system radical SAM enzyme [Butyrivibrio sp. MC2013]
MAKCDVCFRHCDVKEGQLGFCGGRICEDKAVRAYNYGRITGLALDPIEKKPLARFYPGSYILSAGSFGCNLRCPFCQNYEISWSDEAFAMADTARFMAPEELVELAIELQDRGSIGIAFTYNEPLIGYEYVRDTAMLAHKRGLKTVLVSNGTCELPVLDEIGPCIDAMNIDLKGFTDRYYSEVLKGSRQQVMDFIVRACKYSHLEVTSLIIPGENDSEDEMRDMSLWLSTIKGADGEEIVLHISRFFPRFHMTDRAATDVDKIYRLADIAGENLHYVYTGNC